MIKNKTHSSPRIPLPPKQKGGDSILVSGGGTDYSDDEDDGNPGKPLKGTNQYTWKDLGGGGDDDGPDETDFTGTFGSHGESKGGGSHERFTAMGSNSVIRMNPLKNGQGIFDYSKTSHKNFHFQNNFKQGYRNQSISSPFNYRQLGVPKAQGIQNGQAISAKRLRN